MFSLSEAFALYFFETPGHLQSLSAECLVNNKQYAMPCITPGRILELSGMPLVPGELQQGGNVWKSHAIKA